MGKEKIEQENRRKILLLLNENDLMSKGELVNKVGVERSTMKHHLDKLNDIGAVHESRSGYSIVDRNVTIERNTSMYLREIQSFIPSILLISIGFTYAALTNIGWTAPIIIGGLLGILPPFAYRIYKFLSSSEYINIYTETEEKSEVAEGMGWET